SMPLNTRGRQASGNAPPGAKVEKFPTEIASPAFCGEGKASSHQETTPSKRAELMSKNLIVTTGLFDPS
ncbi:MAG: hypothetical protein ACOWYE_10185, partial [Desulfatiglandales bacterium]